MGRSDALVSVFMGLLALVDKVFKDQDQDQVRRSHANAIRELQRLPASSMVLIPGVPMPADGHVFVKHGLGRAPLAVFVSPPRNDAGLTVGLISEARGSIGGATIDSRQMVVLVAGAFTNSFTVDVMVL